MGDGHGNKWVKLEDLMSGVLEANAGAGEATECNPGYFMCNTRHEAGTVLSIEGNQPGGRRHERQQVAAALGQLALEDVIPSLSQKSRDEKEEEKKRGENLITILVGSAGVDICSYCRRVFEYTPTLFLIQRWVGHSDRFGAECFTARQYPSMAWL